MNTSKERMGRGGDKFLPFPTYYTNNPEHVLGARTRSRDRWQAAPKYKLFNVDDRDVAIKKYDKVCFVNKVSFVKIVLGAVGNKYFFPANTPSYQLKPAPAERWGCSRCE